MQSISNPSLKTIKELSDLKKEPYWMYKKRISAYKIFSKLSIPEYLSPYINIDLNNINYYLKPTEKKVDNWQELPNYIRKTYDYLKLPEAEKKMLVGGVTAQFESEIVYESIQKTLRKKGVVFLSMEEGVRKYPDIIKEYFGKLIKAADNKYTALNTAFWSGGSFLYVPKGVKVELPLQAYFRIESEKMGQFERTLIIADEGSSVHYMEGCSAPIYSTYSLHAGVVEIFVKKGARVRYTTVQNWSKNVYNLVTKRMLVEEEGVGEWVDGNIGAKMTVKYPCVILNGKGAKTDILSISIANHDQYQETGAKAIHLSDSTTSNIVSKSISKNNGKSVFRGYVFVDKGLINIKSKLNCNSLLIDKNSSSYNYPKIEALGTFPLIEQEASISKLKEEEIFYVESRGFNRSEAQSLIVNGFIEPIVKEMPLEYAVEINRLIDFEMEGNSG